MRKGKSLWLLLGIVFLTGCVQDEGKDSRTESGQVETTSSFVEQEAESSVVEQEVMSSVVEQETVFPSIEQETMSSIDKQEEMSFAAAQEGVPTQEELSEEEESSAEISVIMVGDILLHTPVEEAAKQEDGSYNFNAIFTNLQEEIQAADLAIVNQEVIIGGEELGISGYPAFNAPFEVGDALVKAGFDVVCHGTNHALDKGKKGLISCIDFWKENYPEIAILGIHESQEEQDNIFIYEQDDIRVAVLNYTYGTNGISLPDDMPFAVDMLEKERVIADIQRAEESADFTILCPHWGTEYKLEPSAEQEMWTEIFLENGVDLVLGTHPHVIEPVEWVVDEETGHKMLVYYSLGNFVNWTSGTGEGVANRMVGGMAQVNIAKEEEGAVISDYGIMPVVCHLEEGVNGVTVYRLSEYTSEMAEENRIGQQDSNFSLAYCEELCQRVWGDMVEGE